jgi:hypothetical protein
MLDSRSTLFLKIKPPGHADLCGIELAQLYSLVYVVRVFRGSLNNYIHWNIMI